MSLDVRPVTAGDRTEVRRVVAEAFGEEGAHVVALVEALEEAGHLRAGLVALQDDELVGHVQLSRAWVDARERLVEVLVLSPLSVAPAHQRRGIGSRLVEAAVAVAEERGAPALFLEGSPDYYGARGFRRGSAAGFERPSVRIPDPAFQVVTFGAHEPWMTGRLVYGDAFWALDCVGLRDPLLARLEERFADL